MIGSKLTKGGEYDKRCSHKNCGISRTNDSKHVYMVRKIQRDEYRAMYDDKLRAADACY